MATKTFEIEWEDIKGYEGLYQVSTMGLVRGIKSGKTLSPDETKDGYERITLYKDSKPKHFLVHRLVAETFIPNPDNLSEVNHKDENKQNNSQDNLEWISAKDNCNYGTRNRKIALSKNKPILQLSLGKFIREWESAAEVARVLGYAQGNICSCCNGNRNTAHKFKWMYK